MIESQRTPKYQLSDIVMFKFSRTSNRTYNGVILEVRTTKKVGNLYSIASMEHGMRSFTFNEEYIVKKIA